jgi:hypothetical protein
VASSLVVEGASDGNLMPAEWGERSSSRRWWWWCGSTRPLPLGMQGGGGGVAQQVVRCLGHGYLGATHAGSNQLNDKG